MPKRRSLNLTEKIIARHLVVGRMAPGEPIALRIDQTLTQDATGTMAYLQFEAMGVERVRTRLSVSYVDHNLLQTGFENADDHRYLQTLAANKGLYFSRPGNGICHQVHLERFAAPGVTLLGSDSHTPTAGGIASLAMGAGGLDVACAMAGRPFSLACPRVIGVRFIGRLRPWVSAKDVILEVLRRLTVRGGVGAVMEYFGPGVERLSVPERATITNQGTELGATSSIFPSDGQTRRFLAAQARERAYRPLAADPGCQYDETLEIDLSALEPLVAQPGSPDAMTTVRALEGLPIAQVCVGSCTNSSAVDLIRIGRILRGRRVHPAVSMTVSPGSRQALMTAARTGAVAAMLEAGVRLLECGCGPCLGMGQAPASGVASLRSFNRNFPGRSGTQGDRVYLASNEVCAASAVAGELRDPRRLGPAPRVTMPRRMVVDDSLIIKPRPPGKAGKVEIVRGPNIQPVPRRGPLEETLEGAVLIKVGDHVSTDAILPAGAKVLPLRSNIPAISEYCFAGLDPTFAARAKAAGGGFIVAGTNYGQGSSREHAALAPMFLGVKAVLAGSFARIHRANLINFGIVPLVFADGSDLEALPQGAGLRIEGVAAAVRSGAETVTAAVLPTGRGILLRLDLTDQERQVLLAGGMLNCAARA